MHNNKINFNFLLSWRQPEEKDDDVHEDDDDGILCRIALIYK